MPFYVQLSCSYDKLSSSLTEFIICFGLLTVIFMLENPHHIISKRVVLVLNYSSVNLKEYCANPHLKRNQ